MRTRRLSVRLGLVWTGLRGDYTACAVDGGGAVALGGEDRGVNASGVMLDHGCSSGSDDAVSGVLMIGRSM